MSMHVHVCVCVCVLLVRWWTGQCWVSVDVMVLRAPSGLVHKVLTPSVTMIHMVATWSLRFMAGR